VRSLISKFRLSRLQTLLSGTSNEENVKPGKAETGEIQEAIASVEAMVCESLVHCFGAIGARNGDNHRHLLNHNAFGRQVIESRIDKTSGAIAAASGFALTGVRSAVFVPGDNLASGFSQLQSVANRHIPLLIHASFREGFGSGSSHSGYHGASDLGLFQILPHSVQQSVDFTLLARWLSERALVPGLLGYDRHLIDKFFMPSSSLVQEYLGLGENHIPAPTPAQMLLFGEKRILVPKWFDFDRPVSFSSLQGSSDGASAAAGRHSFFWKHLKELANEGMERLSRLTGRDLSYISYSGEPNADYLIVTQGSAYSTACAAAMHLKDSQKMKVGVLGLTWLRPFPAEEVRKALTGRKGVLVLECAGAPLAENTPLYRELQNVVTSASSRWMTGVYGMNGQPLHVGELASLVEELKKTSGRKTAWLGIKTGQLKAGNFPKREGLVQAIANDYREIAETATPATPPVDPTGESVKAIQWIGSADLPAGEIMNRLADTVSDIAGKEIKGFGWAPEPGVFSVRICSGQSGIQLAEAGTRLDVLLLGKHGLDLIYNPLTDLGKGAQVVIESDRSPAEIWSLLPEDWRADIRRLDLNLYTVAGGFDDLNTAVSAILSDSVEMPFQKVDWKNLSDPRYDSDEVPELIRRVKQSGSNYDNLPRFWGEIMQPKRGGISDNFPDPLTTLNAVPPYTAALARPRGTALPNIPVLDPDKCTGCGICWPVCPDSAIGVTAVGVQELLDGAALMTGEEGKVANAVKRAHKAVAAKVASEIKQSKVTTVSANFLNACYKEIAGKLRISTDDRLEHDRILESTAESAASVFPIATQKLFHAAEQSQKDSGKLLVLSINPDACQGCQICINSCPESALVAHDRAEQKSAALKQWKIWESLPDTSGAFIAQQAGENGIGSLAAHLLSRHASQVQAVGSFGEPGSGERLAIRLVTSLIEAVTQKRLNELAKNAGEASESLRKLVHAQLAEGLESADSDLIQEALKGLPRRRASLSDLNERLTALGKGISVDPVKTLRLTQTAQQLEDLEWSIKEGLHGLGRSRFGVAIISDRIGRWAGRFPNHPYQSPLIVDISPDGCDLVSGLAGALVQRHVDGIRALHKAKLYEENPPDLPGRLLEIEKMTWADLTEEEKKSCPPLILLTDETSLKAQGLEAIDNLLGSTFPVKIVLADSRDFRDRSGDPSLLAISRQTAFVLRTSLSSTSHFAKGIESAMNYWGPALIHIHTPIPSAQGFNPSRTIERAKTAVEAKVNPLLVYDPTQPGVFGEKLSLEGNPSLEKEFGKLTPVEWALGEQRFKNSFEPVSREVKGISPTDYLKDGSEGDPVIVECPETGDPMKADSSLLKGAKHCLRIWDVYREIAGVENPFSERIRKDLASEIEAQHSQEVGKMKEDYEARIKEVQSEFDAKMNAKLRDRLLVLAGFNPSNQ
jgi:pyruvate-ferredoxin/flavodoxin oxidoreductase